MLRGTIRGGTRTQVVRDYRKQLNTHEDADALGVIMTMKRAAERRKLKEKAEKLGKDPFHPAVARFRAVARTALVVSRVDPERFGSEPPPPQQNIKPWRKKFADIRYEINTTLDVPNKNTLSNLINILLLMLISLSTIQFILQTVPGMESLPVWDTIEVVVVSIFSAEFLLRLLTTSNYKAFFMGILNWVDLAAILPFYVELLLVSGSTGNFRNLRVLRSVRLMRIFRIFKASKHSVHFQLLVDTLMRSYDELLVLVFILIIAVIVFAGGMYFLEKGEYHPVPDSMGVVHSETSDPFESIPSSCWWAIVTMTTVGYGDAIPVTIAGKLVASFCMLIGILVVALPVTIVGSSFSEVYRSHSGRIATDNAKTATDNRLKQSNYLNLIQEVRSQRAILIRIFTEVEQRVGQWRFHCKRPSIRPWSLAEQALFDGIVQDMKSIEDHLIHSSCANVHEHPMEGVWSGFIQMLKGKRQNVVVPQIIHVNSASILRPDSGRPITPTAIKDDFDWMQVSESGEEEDEKVSKKADDEEEDNEEHEEGSSDAGGVGWLVSRGSHSDAGDHWRFSDTMHIPFEPEKLFLPSSRSSEDSDSVTQVTSLRPLPITLNDDRDGSLPLNADGLPVLVPLPPRAVRKVTRLRPLPPKPVPTVQEE